MSKYSPEKQLAIAFWWGFVFGGLAWGAVVAAFTLGAWLL